MSRRPLVKICGVTRVEDAQGKVLETRAPRMEEGLSPQTAYLITHLMRNVLVTEGQRVDVIIRR